MANEPLTIFELDNDKTDYKNKSKLECFLLGIFTVTLGPLNQEQINVFTLFSCIIHLTTVCYNIIKFTDFQWRWKCNLMADFYIYDISTMYPAGYWDHMTAKLEAKHMGRLQVNKLHLSEDWEPTFCQNLMDVIPSDLKMNKWYQINRNIETD